MGAEHTEEGPETGLHSANGATAELAELWRSLTAQYPVLLRVLTRRCGKGIEAADILHEALRIAIEHYHAGRIGCAERAPGYVYRVALNLLRNYRRALGVRAEYLGREGAAEPDESPGAIGEILNESLAKHLRAALNQLRMERDRLILQRHYIHDEDKESVCRELNLSPKVFDKLAYRARARVKRTLVHRGVSSQDLAVQMD